MLFSRFGAIGYGAGVLDTFERFELDSSGLIRQLEALPGSYDGPTRTMPAPYGVIGFGEGALPAEFAREFIDAASVSGGTQFILAGGLDFGQVEAARLISEASGATVFQLGQPVGLKLQLSAEEASLLLEDDEDSTTRITSSPFSTYHYAMALAHTTGNAERATATDEALARLRDACRGDVSSEENPAKRLAWSLWTRTPMLIAAGGFQPQLQAWQSSLSRLGKSMSVPIVGNPLEIAASGFEARHESGDALVALFLGGEDETLRLTREILETRLDEVIEVPTTERDGFVANLSLWYLSCWVGLYLSLLYGQDPKDSASFAALHDVR